MLLKFPYQIFTFFMQEESEQEYISLHNFTPMEMKWIDLRRAGFWT